MDSNFFSFFNKEVETFDLIFKNNYQDVKSKYILQKIFEYIQKKKLLEMIKYNRKLKQKLNININDYIKYSETYSSIIIEIIPCYNKYGRFINLDLYLYTIDNYQLNFYNNKKEIKRNYINFLKEEDEITKIVIKIDYNIESLKGLFSGCECVESICFKQFYRNNIIDMSHMFSRCSSLKEINFSYFNTINVTNMSNMFSRCSSLKKLDLSNFDTNNVIDMSDMFSRCSSLEYVDLFYFNTFNVTNMNSMFLNCSSLQDLDLSNFDTKNVILMKSMFSGCVSLLTLDITNFDMNKVINMSNMFYNCCSLKEIYLSNLNVNEDTIMNSLFLRCSDKIKMKIKSHIRNIKEETFYEN